jgi:hypothetical protein
LNNQGDLAVQGKEILSSLLSKSKYPLILTEWREGLILKRLQRKLNRKILIHIIKGLYFMIQLKRSYTHLTTTMMLREILLLKMKKKMYLKGKK